MGLMPVHAVSASYPTVLLAVINSCPFSKQWPLQNMKQKQTTGSEVNALDSHYYCLGPIPGINTSDGLWSPSQTGVISLNTPVSPHSKTSGEPLSVPTRETFHKLS